MKKTIYKEIVMMNALLCLGVVLIHLTSVPLTTLKPDRVMYVLFFSMNRLLCFCVPSFIFLAGFKLFGRYGEDKIDLKQFFKRRLTKIVVPYLIAVAVYFTYLLYKNSVAISAIPQYIFLGTLVAHFYYIIIAVQCYLLFPLLKNVFNKYPIWVTVLALICTICFNEFVHFPYSDRFVGTYILYFVLGMLFKKYDLGRKISKYYIVNLTGYIIVSFMHIRLFYLQSLGQIIYNYASIANIVYVFFSIVFIYSSCLWISDKSKLLSGVSQAISNVSYNVYLYHILVMFVLQYEVLNRIDVAPPAYFMTSLVVVYGLIFLYSYLHRKIRRQDTDLCSGRKNQEKAAAE